MITRYYDLSDRSNERARRIRLKERELYERDPFPVSFFTHERDVLEFASYDLGDDLIGWTEIQDGTPRIAESGETEQNSKFPHIVLETVEHLKSIGVDKGSLYISYQFLKNRVGTSIIGNRVFIQEISPSRTEVRILPALTGENEIDYFLVRDFEHFKHNDIFIDDVYLTVIWTYESIFVEQIDSLMNENFLFQFRYDYGVSSSELERIKAKIIEQTRLALLDRILQEDDDFMSRNRLQQLFIIVLQEVVDECIPHINEDVIVPGSDLGIIRKIDDRYDVPVLNIPQDEIITGDYDPGRNYDNTPTQGPPPIPPTVPAPPQTDPIQPPQPPQPPPPPPRPPTLPPVIPPTDPPDQPTIPDTDPRFPLTPPDPPVIPQPPVNTGADDGYGGIGGEPGSSPGDMPPPDRFPIDDTEDRDNPQTVN